MRVPVTAAMAALALATFSVGACGKPGPSPQSTTKVATTAASAQAEPVGPSPQAFLEGVYANYRKKGVPGALTKPEAVFGGEMLALIQADQNQPGDGVGYVDADPVCGCQDYDQTSEVITITKNDGATAEAKVAFTNMGKVYPSTLDLAMTPGGWRITDIHRPDVPSFDADLRANLPKKP